MDDSIQIMKAVKNQAKQSILVYLLIYSELTLDQLSNLLKKSKSTIHHHMQQLLELKLITEESKPGRKTIYYKIKTFRTDFHMEKTYGFDYVKELPLEIQSVRLNDLLEHNVAFTLLMQNIIKLKFEKINQIKKDMQNNSQTNLSLLERAQDQFSAIYLANPKQAEEFKEDIKQLIRKYYDKEDEHEDLVRPTTFMILGMNVKEVLDRKINDK
ncbi:MAG: helix-turn-helix transcriptional regulator [Asgard group archaeon]|nr:helix-turn-helix transcriptional regulator [Asgard group archaeon]